MSFNNLKADTMKKWILRVLLILFLAGVIWVVNLLWFKPFSIRHFFDRSFLVMMLDEPEIITFLRIPVLYDLTRGKLTDVSDAKQWTRFERTRKAHQTLMRYDVDRQSAANQLNIRILDEYFDYILESEPFFYHGYNLEQITGIHVELPALMEIRHQLRNRRDAEAYIDRLGLFGTKFDQVIEGLKIRKERGIILPDFIIEQILADIDDFLGYAMDEDISTDHLTNRVARNALYAGFQQRLGEVENLSYEGKEQYLTQASEIIAESVFPAYDRLKLYLEDMLEVATADAGVWRLPDGDAYYRFLIRQQTTANISPEEIHRIGLEEVDRIQDDIRNILEREGYAFSGRSFGDVVREMAQESQFLFPNTVDGREQLLEQYRAIGQEMDLRLHDYFDLLPTAGVEVQRIPEFQEASSPKARYNPPAMDGSKGGIFYVNLRDVTEHPSPSLKTLSYHEANPGHHLQVAIQLELPGLPIFRKVILFGSYIEGWAMYAERLAWEIGMYTGDPYGNVGRLQAELFRAVRMVVDTGIHLKRWSRGDAISYMYENTGFQVSGLATEVDRYVIWPGQAVTYTVGLLKMLELRKKSREALGERFDIKQFHNAVLEHGSLPLGILEDKVDVYIAGQK